MIEALKEYYKVHPHLVKRMEELAEMLMLPVDPNTVFDASQAPEIRGDEFLFDEQVLPLEVFDQSSIRLRQCIDEYWDYRARSALLDDWLESLAIAAIKGSAAISTENMLYTVSSASFEETRYVVGKDAIMVKFEVLGDSTAPVLTREAARKLLLDEFTADDGNYVFGSIEAINVNTPYPGTVAYGIKALYTKAPTFLLIE